MWVIFIYRCLLYAHISKPIVNKNDSLHVTEWATLNWSSHPFGIRVLSFVLSWPFLVLTVGFTEL